MKVYVVVHTFGTRFDRLEVYSSRSKAMAVVDKHRRDIWTSPCFLVETEVIE